MKEKEIFHEKNISAKQKAPSKNTRVSCKNENSHGTKNHQSQKKAWPQETSSISYKFPKSFRILKREDFKKISLNRQRLKSKYIIVDYIFDLTDDPRIGIAASKKFGKAHERNRFKRITREAFRLIVPSLSLAISFIVRPTYCAKNAKMQDIQKDLLFLFKLAKRK